MATTLIQSIVGRSFTEHKPEESSHSAHTNLATDKRCGLADIGQGRLAGITRGDLSTSMGPLSVASV
jgi:hypothetical protein